MSKIAIALSFAAGLIAGVFINLSSKSLQAAQSERTPCAFAKNFGSLKAAVNEYLVFEASDGTIRTIQPENCRLVYVLIRN